MNLRFSLIAGPRQRPDKNQPASEAWWNYVDDAILAEKLGFDSAFIGEHHFCFASGNSSPFVMLAAIASRTERLRIGTSIICMPFHNPLRVAEDIAAVDIASRGRFDFGVGVGSQYEEFETFGTPTVVSKGAPWAGLEAKAAGWWSDVGIEPLAAALHDAMSRTSSELQAMGEQGQAWMKDEFAWHSVGSRMSDTDSWRCDRSIPVPRWVRLD